MEKRIELEKRHRTPDQVTELNLDNCKGCVAVEGLTDEFVNLHTLSLIGSGLTSLKGFPKLPKLKKLELSDNKITGGLNILKDCEKLSSLNLSGNRIKDLATLVHLKELQNLRALDLYNNEVTSSEDYRNKVFELLPQLSFLDGTDKAGKELEESDDDDEDEEDDEEEEENGEVKVNGSKGRANNAGGADDQVEDEESDLDGDEEEFLDEEDSAEEVGLKDLYNDDLEDDESDAYEEEEEDEEDNDISDEDDVDGNGRLSMNNSTASSTAAASADGSSSKTGQDGAIQDGKSETASGEEAVAVSDGKGVEDGEADSRRGTKRKLEEEEGEEVQANLN